MVVITPDNVRRRVSVRVIISCVRQCFRPQPLTNSHADDAAEDVAHGAEPREVDEPLPQGRVGARRNTADEPGRFSVGVVHGAAEEGQSSPGAILPETWEGEAGA